MVTVLPRKANHIMVTEDRRSETVHGNRKQMLIKHSRLLPRDLGPPALVRMCTADGQQLYGYVMVILGVMGKGPSIALSI